MIYVFLAEGFEEVEALTPVDILRRAGKEVVTVGVGGKTVAGSHGIPVTADITADEAVPGSGLEGVILPGGMPGTLNLEKSEFVSNAIHYCADKGLLLAAICAAPSVLGKAGLLKGKRAVCYDGFEKYLDGAAVGNEAVCNDGNVITACGASAALKFAIAITEYLCGKDVSENIARGILCNR